MLINQKRCRLGGVRRHRTVADRPVIVGNLVSLLGRVVAVCMVVFRAMVADRQVPVALWWTVENGAGVVKKTMGTHLEVVLTTSVASWNASVSRSR